MLVVIIVMIFLAVVGGYIVTSILLLKYPTLLHKKKEIKFKAVHISHRGGAGENLENTITAFKHAAAAGTEMLELDCHITKDGEVVVLHDEDLSRIAGFADDIHNVLYKDIPPLNCSLRLDFQHDHITHGGEDRTIPLLRDVFENFPGMPINIDIKVNSDELIRKVSDLAILYDRENITVWGNRSTVVTNKCYKQNPNIHLLFSMKRVLQLLAFFYTGLLPFVPLRESFYEVIMPSILLKSGRFRSDFNSKQRLLFKICDFLIMNRAMIKHLSDRGVQTYLWVLNEDSEYERAFSYGATGVMTDFPTELSRYLREHPQYWCN